jgi:hypothetical protein
MLESIRQMCEMYQMYFGNILYGIIVVFVVGLFIRYRTKENMCMLAVCGIILVLFMNPFSLNFLRTYANSKRVIRIFWAIPLAVGNGYAGVKLLNGKKTWKKALLLVVSIFLLFESGGTILNGQNYAKECNAYKIPQDVIEVAEAVEANSLPEWEHPCVMTTIYLSTYLRQYDGNIHLLYGRGKDASDAGHLYKKMKKYMATDIPYEELYDIGQEAVSKGANMLVFLKYQVQNEALETLGFERIDCLEDYYIFRRG